MHKISRNTLKDYILGGKGIITVVSVKTGRRFTYKFQTPADDAPIFVSVLSGPDNINDYMYMGMIWKRSKFVITKKSKVGATAPCAVAFSWVFRAIMAGKLPEAVEVYHEGTCGRCGRKLTVPSSIITGLGPVCAGRMVPQLTLPLSLEKAQEAVS